MTQIEPETRTPWERFVSAMRRGGPVLVVRLAYELVRSKTWLRRRHIAITVKRRLARIPVVHAIGDSHTEVLQGVSPFVTTWLGGATAFNLGTDGSTTGSKEKLEAALKAVRKRRDVVLLVVGEIDCRIHVYNQYMKGEGAVPMESIIDATIERYGAVARSLKSRGFRVVLHGAPAAAREDNIYCKPFYADEATRAWIVREFNCRLGAWCDQNDVEFLDVYPRVADSSGFIRPELTEDGVHLGPAALPIYQEWVRGLDARRR